MYTLQFEAPDGTCVVILSHLSGPEPVTNLYQLAPSFHSVLVRPPYNHSPPVKVIPETEVEGCVNSIIMSSEAVHPLAPVTV